MSRTKNRRAHRARRAGAFPSGITRIHLYTWKKTARLWGANHNWPKEKSLPMHDQGVLWAAVKPKDWPVSLVESLEGGPTPFTDWWRKYQAEPPVTRSPTLGHFKCMGGYSMPACEECGGRWTHEPGCSQCTATASVLDYDYGKMDARIFFNFIAQSQQAAKVQAKSVAYLKSQGYTQQVPGWDGVLVSPDGNTIAEVG